jgi:putative colanic acid biosynthesis acetyltransferase WcaF
MKIIDLSKYENKLGRVHQLKRLLWICCWTLLAKPLPRSFGRKWKLLLVRIFGAKVHSSANIYSTVRIYAPWNLEMHAYSCLAPEVDCYNVGRIIIGEHSTISQKTYLCAASHDVTKSNYPLIYKPIVIQDQVWVGAEVFIGMGVTIKQGAIVGARSAVFKDVEPWTIVGGNPARFIKNRIIDKE